MRVLKLILPIATVLALLISQAFLISSNSVSSTVANSNSPTNVKEATDSEGLLQYEWGQIHADSAFTRFSMGPAPESPDILWKTRIDDIQSYITAFDGKVFVTTSTNVIALDKDAGSIIWNSTLPVKQRWPTVYKIDGAHLVVGKNCLDPETGEVLWVSDEFAANTAYFETSVYSPEEKSFYTKSQSTVQAWNFSDPSKPPTLEWESYVPGGASVGSGVQYGGGKVFPGSFDPHQMAIDAKTGKIIWDTETTGAMMFSGSYYKGRFFRGNTDNNFYCFNATTGEVLWLFNPGTQFGGWCSGCAVAYGKVYSLNKDGNLYAIDINAGKLTWKYQGPSYLFWPGWPVLADGKIYATTGQNVSINPFTGQYSKSEFACLDAYSGNLLWKLPIQAYAPRESVAIAYGNLYLIPGYIKEDKMDSYTTFNKVWALSTMPWPMWRHDSEHTGAGQSGPTNLTLRWKFTTHGAVISSPSVVDGRVYVGSYDKNLYCLDAITGRLLWSYAIGVPIKSSPAVIDGKVFIGPDDGNVYCIDAVNGDVVWTAYAGGYIQPKFNSVVTLRSSPVVVDGRVYVGSLDNNTYCLDAGSGDVIWTYKTAGYIASSPAVVDGAVYVTSQEPTFGAMYKLNATTSGLIWKLQIPYQFVADRGTDMMSSPVVADGIVYASANKYYHYGINASTGEILWAYRNIADEYIVDSASYHEGKLFFVDQFFLVCVNVKNNSTMWRSWLGEGIESSPTHADDKVYVAGSDTRLIYVLNATNGERLSWFETGSKCWSSPTIYGSRLYVGNHDWNVYCLADASFPIIPTSIVAKLDKNIVNQTQDESVTVTGQIKPGISNAPITLTIVKPDGDAVNLTLITNDEGTFTVSYTPNAVGNWTLTALYSGAEYLSHIYTSSSSEELPLQVVAVSSPELPKAAGLPPELVFIGIASVVATVATIMYLRVKRQKK